MCIVRTYTWPTLDKSLFTRYKKNTSMFSGQVVHCTSSVIYKSIYCLYTDSCNARQREHIAHIFVYNRYNSVYIRYNSVQRLISPTNNAYNNRGGSRVGGIVPLPLGIGFFCPYNAILAIDISFLCPPGKILYPPLI